MKKILVILSLSWFVSGYAQTDSSYSFTVDREWPATSVKNQHKSGTCWSYSAVSFLESEALRKGKPEYDLSEMWVVRHTYPAKAEKYVRMHGAASIAGGGAFEDVLWVARNYGMVPQEVYQGLDYGEKKNVHDELDAAAAGYVKSILGTAPPLSTGWLSGFQGIMDAYLGACPEKFKWQGKEYTPTSFWQSLSLNPDDYVSITSYTHHPFYEPFILEVPDNWIWGKSYNIPMSEMLEVINNALNNGYTVLWAADVSEKGYAYRKGIAVVPEVEVENMSGTDRARWTGVSDKDREDKIYKLDRVVAEKHITQEMRQEAFDNFTTTDDHGMHIIGIAHNQDGSVFYKVKNSWGTDNSKYNGYFYASVPFVLYKTMDIMVHKDALPKAIAKKLGLK